jgi:hypothetical protein
MTENVINVQTLFKFAIFVNNELVLINNCDERMAAILSSDPTFEEVTQ